MSRPKHCCLLVADFNLAPLAGYLRHDPEYPLVETVEAPYGQVVRVLAGEDACWQKEPDCCLVWTRPEGVSAAFASLLRGEAADLEELDREVEAFAALLKQAGRRVRLLCAPSWWVPTFQRGLGMADLRPGGVGHALWRMNTRLVERLQEERNIFVLNAQKWVESAGPKAFQARLWYMGKIAFGNEVFKEAVRDLKAALRGMEGRAKKWIALDLDNTLWGGVVGEVGREGLKLGGHDPVGEAFVDFQRALKGLVRRGVLLAIASRSEERMALEAIDRHPEMVLRRQDFAAWRIDWGDKAENIAALAEELNIGLQDGLFIDDSPAERARVRQALPEVLVPEWPEDPSRYAAALEGLRCFDAPSLSREDRKRTALYAAERKRQAIRREVGSVEEWLRTLELRVRVEALGRDNLARVAQLLNKTNQMNLCTRRLSEGELMAWAKGQGRWLWTFGVRDRFGDAGLTGLLGLEEEGELGRIADFVLSCRVMGRQVEEAMVHWGVRQARERGWKELRARYLPTARNRPCLDFFARALKQVEPHGFCWDTGQEFPLPAHVELSG